MDRVITYRDDFNIGNVGELPVEWFHGSIVAACLSLSVAFFLASVRRKRRLAFLENAVLTKATITRSSMAYNHETWTRGWAKYSYQLNGRECNGEGRYGAIHKVGHEFYVYAWMDGSARSVPDPCIIDHLGLLDRLLWLASSISYGLFGGILIVWLSILGTKW